MTRANEGDSPRISRIGQTYTEDLADIPPKPTPTPFFHPMIRTLGSVFEATVSAVTACPSPVVALSVPCDVGMASQDLILDCAKSRRFLVSCTNRLEQDRAKRRGFSESDIVLSGPAKFWPEGFGAPGSRATFCDSLEELEKLVGHIKQGEEVAEYIGATLRLAEARSRLGVPVSTKAGLEGLCEMLAELPATQKLCLEFRPDSSRIGIPHWKFLARGFLDLAAAIGNRIGRTISCIGLGGNWFSEDWIFTLEGPIRELAGKVAETLPGVSLLILDGGQAFAQPSQSLITRVLEVRRTPLMEVVVDAAIAELPDSEHFPHRVSWRSSNDLIWRSVRPGRASILGRLNLEADVLARRLEIPEGLATGDLLAFCDAGGCGLGAWHHK